MQSPPRHHSALIPLGMLASRLILFLLFQAVIALIARSWDTSEKYWLLTATLTNIVSIMLLYHLLRSEGKNYLNMFRFNRPGYKKDLLIFLGITLLSGPVVFVPGYFISKMIWNDPNVPAAMMFGQLDKGLVYMLLVAFPVTIAFAELATYFGYIMPALRKQLKTKWLALLLPVLFLSFQHCALPFIPDSGFLLYRALVFLPFAFLIGLSIYFRPSLFPYFVVLHGIMDFGTVVMFLLQDQ